MTRILRPMTLPLPSVNSNGDPLEVSEIQRFAPDALPMRHLAFDGAQQLRDFLDGVTAVR